MPYNTIPPISENFTQNFGGNYRKYNTATPYSLHP